MESLLFTHRESSLRTLIAGAVIRLAVIPVLRMMGKGTASQMNASGFLIPVTLGSSFATVAFNVNV